MKKTFELENLDCANCGAKIENEVKALPGVNNASVSFLMQKITIDADDSVFDEIVKKAAQICKKTEAECELIIK